MIRTIFASLVVAFGVSLAKAADDDTVSYTHLTLPTNREV